MDKLTRLSLSMGMFLSAAGCGGAEPDSPSVAIHGLLHGSDGTSLSGARVCVQSWPANDIEICTQSGDGGSFTLERVPANRQLLVVTFQKAGFLPMLRAVETRRSDLTLSDGGDGMLAATDPPTFMGIPTDPNKGHIAFRVTTPEAQAHPVAPVALMALDSGDSSQPLYVGAGGWPALNATAGSRDGFVNAHAGLYTLRIGGGSTKCAASRFGDPSADAHATSGQAEILVPVLPGYVTAPVSASCVSVRE
jgi:hypothetical protein